jgi:hypothetical protein
MRRSVLTCAAVLLVLSGYAPLRARAVDARGFAAGDITAARISAGTEPGIPASMNGAVLELDIAGVNTGGTYDTDFDFSSNNVPNGGEKVICTVTSEGYDASGVLGTTTRTIYGVPDRNTEGLRKAYSDQLVANEVDLGTDTTIRIALSDYVYVEDTSITCDVEASLYTENSIPNNAVNDIAVTNNSTAAYPMVVGRWAWPAYEIVTGDFTLEAIAFHRFAKDGKPVARVLFACTDGTTENTAAATAMTVSSRTGVGDAASNKVLVYAVTMSSAGWTDNATITCNFKAYPWVGDADNLLDSATTGVSEPDERLTPFKVVFDNDNDYGYKYAVVDFTNGNDSSATTWLYNTQTGVGSAEEAYGSATTNSYKYIWRALAACDAAGLGGRTDPGGCTVLISNSGTINWPGATPGSVDLGAQATYATITRLSTITRAQAVITADGTGDAETRKLKFYDVTLFSASGAVRIGGESASGDVIWVDNCTINLTATAAPIVGWRLAHATRNTVTALTGGFNTGGGLTDPWIIIRGNDGPNSTGPAGAQHISGQQYVFIGNNNLRPLFQRTGNTGSHATSDNSIVAFNTAYTSTTPWSTTSASGTAVTLAIGVAWVQNLIEAQDNTNFAGEFDYNNQDWTNVLIWHNTLAGSRIGIGYNDTGTAAVQHYQYSIRGNVFAEYANKDDTFGTQNAARTGSWPVGYCLGCVGNHRLESGGGGDLEGEFHGLHSIIGGTWSMVDDASQDNGLNNGDDSGNGDYHLGESASGYSLIPGTSIPIPFDLAGTSRDTAGTGSAGVFEMSPATGVGTRKSMMLMGVGEWFQEWWR